MLKQRVFDYCGHTQLKTLVFTTNISRKLNNS